MSRGGEKLKFAVDHLGLDLEGVAAADFGCHVGGFTDCLLLEGASRVYSVDTGYGVLAWKLRQDERVVVMERTNAMHVELPEPVDLVAIDVAWTPQRRILPNALKQAKAGGEILSLLKPQYEAPPELVRRGRVEPVDFAGVVEQVSGELAGMGIHVREVVCLPHERKSKNPEAFLHIRCAECGPPGSTERFSPSAPA